MTRLAETANCARCDRLQREVEKWPEGPVCRTCVRHGLKRRGCCPGCGVDRILPGLDAEGHGVCLDCAGISRSFTCATCRTEGEQWFSSTCLVCSLRRRLTELLDDGTGQVAPRLEPLMASLIVMDQPWSGLIWLSRGDVGARLQALARGTVGIDHAGLDSFPPGKGCEYLRELLMTIGVLEVKDRQLMAFERWTLRWLDAIDDPRHQRLLRTYLLWHHHRDLVARAEAGPLSYATVAVCRSNANSGLRWLQWITRRGRTVATVTQTDIDLWMSTASNPAAAKEFVTWAIRHGHCPPLDLPGSRTGVVHIGPESERRRLLDRLLTDETVGLRERVAGCLVLGLAQSVNRVCQLTLADIEDRDGETFLHLARDPVPLPAALSALLTKLVDTRSNMGTAANRASPWLFPGKSPGNHLCGRALSRMLSRLGVTRPGRQAAFAQLIATLPGPLVARSLGYHPGTVANRAGALGTDWAGYAALKARSLADP
ncbi:MAG: hypothetical protein ABSB09_09010 [Acidimicrobiales bacterium]